MGSGSSYCRQCKTNIDSYGNVQVRHDDYCYLIKVWSARFDSGERAAERIAELERTIDNLNWRERSLRKQNEDFRKGNNDLVRKNQSLQTTLARERKLLQQSISDLSNKAAKLTNDIHAYENELNQVNAKMILDAEKIQNQRNQLRNLNKKQEQFVIRQVFK